MKFPWFLLSQKSLYFPVFLYFPVSPYFPVFPYFPVSLCFLESPCFPVSLYFPVFPYFLYFPYFPVFLCFLESPYFPVFLYFLCFPYFPVSLCFPESPCFPVFPYFPASPYFLESLCLPVSLYFLEFLYFLVFPCFLCFPYSPVFLYFLIPACFLDSLTFPKSLHYSCSPYFPVFLSRNSGLSFPRRPRNHLLFSCLCRYLPSPGSDPVLHPGTLRVDSQLLLRKPRRFRPWTGTMPESAGYLLPLSSQALPPFFSDCFSFVFSSFPFLPNLKVNYEIKRLTSNVAICMIILYFFFNFSAIVLERITC